MNRELGEAETQLRSLTNESSGPSAGCRRSTPGSPRATSTRARLDEQLGLARALLADLETQQEAAREARVHWQVQEAQLAGATGVGTAALDRASAARRRGRTSRP